MINASPVTRSSERIEKWTLNKRITLVSMVYVLEAHADCKLVGPPGLLFQRL